MRTGTLRLVSAGATLDTLTTFDAHFFPPQTTSVRIYLDLLPTGFISAPWPQDAPGDGLKRLRAMVRSFRPSAEQRRMEPRAWVPPGETRKGRPRRGRGLARRMAA